MEVNESAIAYSKQKISIEEYLKVENDAPEKHEYYQGEVFAMSGAKLPHIKITGNLYGTLYTKLKGKKCQPYGNDMRVHIPSNTLFTYPDISIVCGKVETLNNDEYNALNPTVIIEVLSKTTKNYNRGVYLVKQCTSLNLQITNIQLSKASLMNQEKSMLA